MRTQVTEMSLHGSRCLIEQRPRYVVLTSTMPRCEITGGSLEEVVLLFDRFMGARGQAVEQLEPEDEVRQALRMMRLPARPVPVSGRHVLVTQRAGVTRYLVRRTMDGNGRTKLYFGSHVTRHAAARASCRLCELINEEIEARKMALLSVKV